MKYIYLSLSKIFILLNWSSINIINDSKIYCDDSYKYIYTHIIYTYKMLMFIYMQFYVSMCMLIVQC